MLQCKDIIDNSLLYELAIHFIILKTPRVIGNESTAYERSLRKAY